MRKLNKSVAILMAALMLVGLMGVSAMAEQAEDPRAKYEAVDLGGRVIKIAYNWDYVPGNSDYEYDPDVDSPSVLTLLNSMKAVEAKYNCKIEFINLPYEQRIEQITATVMNGEPLADIVSIDIQQMLTLVPNGLLQAYEDIAPENADMFADQIVLAGDGQLFGKTYVVNKVGLPVNGDYMGVNMSIIESLGFEETPLDLYAKGEWTWDKFMEYVKAATQDTDGDGTVDQFGVSGHAHVIFNLLLASNGGMYFDPDTRQQMLDSEATMEAFDLLNTLFNVENAALVADSTTAWDPNLYAFKEGKSAFFPLSTWMIPDGENRVDFDLAIIPTPKGPSNPAEYSFMKLMGGMAILTGVENPTVVYQIYEELNVPDDLDFEAENVDTIDYLETKFADEGDIDRLYALCTVGARYDASSGVPGFPAGDIVQAIVAEGKTPAQAVETYKQVAQDKIDAVFSKAD